MTTSCTKCSFRQVVRVHLSLEKHSCVRHPQDEVRPPLRGSFQQGLCRSTLLLCAGKSLPCSPTSCVRRSSAWGYHVLRMQDTDYRCSILLVQQPVVQWQPMPLTLERSHSARQRQFRIGRGKAPPDSSVDRRRLGSGINSYCRTHTNPSG